MAGSDSVKHIVIYIGSLARGGAQRVAVNLAGEIMKRGCRVSFVTTLVDDDEYELPAISPEGTRRIVSGLTPAEELPGPVGRLINMDRRVKKLRRIFRELAPDIILSFIGKNNIMALLAARPLNIPVFVSVRADPAMEYDSAFLRFMAARTFPHSAGVICQTREAVSAFTGPVQAKAVILPNPVREEFLNMPLCPDGEREKVIVSVGRLDANKNQALMIRAFAAVAGRMQTEKGWKLVIYGDGEDREKLEELIRDPDQKDISKSGYEIELAGSVSDVAQRIRTAEIFLLTSKQEGMPNALIEAMALGIAPISTDCPCGGPRELIRDGINGLLLKLEDDEKLEQTLTESLLRLMTDAALRRRLGTQAATDIRRDFASETVYCKWIDYMLR